MSFKYSLLGSSEQSKVAAHYIGPYVNKNKTPLGESIDNIYEAMKRAKRYRSIAKHTGTNARFVQYIFTRILNILRSLMEIIDTKAAGALLGLNVSLPSESYVFVTSNLVSILDKTWKTLSLKNTAANEVMSDNEDDNASKSDDTSEYKSLSLSTDSK
jgi:hypothetical protein